MKRIVSIHYTLFINQREGYRGHLWQERFHSFPMDEAYLLATVRYVEMNPVVANMVQHAGDYKWSSAKAHLLGQNDHLIKVEPMLNRVENWSDYLNCKMDKLTLSLVKTHTKTGQPLGTESFTDDLEKKAGKVLRPLKQGRKHKESNQ
ncbi:MAG: hypothetical protein Q9M28_08135 [Mariprofundaceae bacterium]|nr:hypothetical protein [Mariprofundaceae bacterium]